MRSATRTAHRNTLGNDDVTWIGVPVLVALHTSARVVGAIERVHVTFLFVGAPFAPPFPPTEHDGDRSRSRLD